MSRGLSTDLEMVARSHRRVFSLTVPGHGGSEASKVLWPARTNRTYMVELRRQCAGIKRYNPTTRTRKLESLIQQRCRRPAGDFCSIAELTEALQSRRISASELLEHTIARIDVLDQRINAVIVRDFDRARTAGEAADAALARGERRPLLGIPATLKEPFNVAGLPTTWGFPQFRDLCRTRMRSLSPG